MFNRNEELTRELPVEFTFDLVMGGSNDLIQGDIERVSITRDEYLAAKALVLQRRNGPKPIAKTFLGIGDDPTGLSTPVKALGYMLMMMDDDDKPLAGAYLSPEEYETLRQRLIELRQGSEQVKEASVCGA